MPQLLVYLLKVSISLAVVYLFYHLVLRKLTFYKWNRFYLLGYTALSMIIPFIDISPVLENKQWHNNGVIQLIPRIGDEVIADGTFLNDPVATFNPWYLLMILLLSGMLLMLLRLLIQWLSFRRLLRGAELLEDGKMKIYKLEGNIIPFSFGNSIFINPSLHTRVELQEIIRHEFVHVKQKHSVDMIWSEIICLLNWYNPFSWMLRHAIRQNLEFIADQNVLEHGVDRKQYQYLLLKVIGNDQFSIAPKFNFSSLKKRIAMMNKMRSAGLHLLKFLFILPLVAVLLLAFRNQHNFLTESSFPFPELRIPATNLIDTIPGPPARPTVAVAPVAPVSPVGTVGSVPPVTPLPSFIISGSDCIPPGKTTITPVASGTNQPKISSDVREFEITRNRATMYMKDGTVEVYYLTNDEQKKKFEKKYGRIYEVSASAPVAFVGGANTPGVVSITPSPSSETNVVDPRSYIINGSEDIIITITPSTTKEQLNAFVEQMKAKDVDLKFENMDFNDGKLISLRGTMKRGNSQSNFTVTDFKKLTLAMTEVDGKVYFKVSTWDEKC